MLYNYFRNTYYLIIFILLTFFFCFRTGFRPTKGGRLIRLVRRDMRTGQTLCPMGIESSIPRICPWNELLATEVQTTWFLLLTFIKHVCDQIKLSNFYDHPRHITYKNTHYLIIFLLLTFIKHVCDKKYTLFNYFINTYYLIIFSF
jgi:hypothetical protein